MAHVTPEEEAAFNEIMQVLESQLHLLLII